MKTIYKVAVILVLIICVAFAKALIGLFTDKYPGDDLVQNMYAREVSDLNKTLPRLVSPDMMFMSAEIEKRTIVYVYEVATSIHDLDYVQFRDERSAILNGACDEIYITETFVDGFEFSFRYFDGSGNHLVSIPLTHKICLANQ